MAGNFQANGGDVLLNSVAGYGVPFTKLVASIVFADANITPVAAVYQNPNLVCTGTNTAQRNLVLPLVAGAEWYVYNDGTGYGLQFIGASGTGIVVANNKGAIIWSDGTNILRKTLDSTVTT